MECEDCYKAVFDHANDLIHMVRLDGTLLHVNPSWIRTLEYTADEVSHLNLYSIVDEADRERFVHYRENILTGAAESREIVVTLRAKSGRKVIVEGVVCLETPTDAPAYTFAIFRDITARVQHQAQLAAFTRQLKESEDNLQQLIRNAPDAIIVIDELSRILLWNPRAEKIFGWKAAEITGSRVFDRIIPPMYREAYSKGVQKYLTSREAPLLNKPLEAWALRKNGDEFPVSFTVSATAQNGQSAFIAFVKDISIQKKNAQALERKQKELDQSNREVEQYSWLASHDLKEPLRKIITFSDLILTQKRSELPEAVERYAEKICKAARRMSHLIDSILAYSNHTSDRHHFEQTDLNEVLQGVLTDLELLIRDNGVHVRTGPLPSIEAAPQQMRQLFQNLVSNAIKYRRKDLEPFVEIMARQDLPGMVQILVRDNGIGMDTNEQEKIFRLFQRIKVSPKLEGTGIGLAMCKKIVERHRGSITVESTPLMGTTFIITLPSKYD
ncbi:PAS domain S-box protein [Paraflavisolibacter sp. H34]|uniref:sensor histidine kinase n=1 Tax=Huijunlia imazamoxiresistens TaxID=3127457 RepID=UPI00301A68C4